MEEQKKVSTYRENLLKANIFFPGLCKGTFILPPEGVLLWENIKKILDSKFIEQNIENVLLPTFVPYHLFEREKKHIEGFNPNLFFVKKKDNLEIDNSKENSIILRPTSEVVFYEWFKQILRSYKQLPIKYNQWCSVFREEKNINPFLRNTEFLWQEGHSIHSTEEEAKLFIQQIISIYKNYTKETLNLSTICGLKSENEKFPGALETYTLECLLPDYQCLQLATVHFFGNNFCQNSKVKFLDKKNKEQYPFSISWGTSTRAIGAIAKTHFNEYGLIIPFDIAPVQIAFIITNIKDTALLNKVKKIRSVFEPKYRCKIYKENTQTSLNLLQADNKGCPIKIIIGEKEIKNNKITLIRRDKTKEKIIIEYKKYDDLLNIIEEQSKKIKENMFKINKCFQENNLNFIKDISEIKDKNYFWSSYFCGTQKCEEEIRKIVKEQNVRCIVDVIQTSKCIFCSAPTKKKAYFGKSY